MLAEERAELVERLNQQPRRQQGRAFQPRSWLSWTMRSWDADRAAERGHLIPYEEVLMQMQRIS